ncbi:aspartate kinase, partial [Candidatus Bathyarchaeota archaeon]|nr:aspartate kinase [Candidatus Bathyarchaeota archaeon]
MTIKEAKREARHLTVAKFGGGVIGEQGQGIPLIIRRIQRVREVDGIGPLAVFSAPKGLTDKVISVGRKCAKGDFSEEYKSLISPYLRISDQHIKDSLKACFEDEVKRHLDEVGKALERIYRNKEFEGGDRAIVLAYSGELLAATMMSYVLNSYGIESCSVPFSEWPVITDRNFESATFLLEESKERTHHLVKRIEEGKVVAIGGFIGSTTSGRETTYERGGSDRSAADLGVILKEFYDVTVDFEKDNVVMSADPNIKGIDKGELSEIGSLSYNETRLAGQYGMSIIDPVAIRDVPPDLDLPLEVTDINTGEKTMIRRHIDKGNSNPIKIVTGRRGCAVLEAEQSKSASLYDFLEGIKKYYEFTELRPYIKNDVRTSRI